MEWWRGVVAVVGGSFRVRWRRVSVVVLVACGLGLWVAKRAVVAPSGAPSPSAAVQGVFGSLSRWADDDALQDAAVSVPGACGGAAEAGSGDPG